MAKPAPEMTFFHLLGCGSVGAPVATNLATAGVARILLVDPDNLDGPNTGRHPLGATNIGNNKAVGYAVGSMRSHHKCDWALGRTDDARRMDKQDAYRDVTIVDLKVRVIRLKLLCQRMLLQSRGARHHSPEELIDFVTT
jgi:hypothetical protein